MPKVQPIELTHPATTGENSRRAVEGGAPPPLAPEASRAPPRNAVEGSQAPEDPKPGGTGGSGPKQGLEGLLARPTPPLPGDPRPENVRA